MQPNNYYEDNDFVKNEILEHKRNADSKYIRLKFVTYTDCIENNHGNFIKINQNIRNLYFKLAAIMNKVF